MTHTFCCASAAGAGMYDDGVQDTLSGLEFADVHSLIIACNTAGSDALVV
jgi:hypothetical protein